MARNVRITDLGDHGPMVITGAETEISENQKSSRIGDIYDCPVHGRNPIVTGSPDSLVENSPTARIGDVTACLAVLITGAATHEVN